MKPVVRFPRRPASSVPDVIRAEELRRVVDLKTLAAQLCREADRSVAELSQRLAHGAIQEPGDYLLDPILKMVRPVPGTGKRERKTE